MTDSQPFQNSSSSVPAPQVLAAKPIDPLDTDALDNVKLKFEKKFKGEEPPAAYIPGVDPSVRDQQCRLFTMGKCLKGNNCLQKHAKPARVVVCKHWLRGLCKKGDQCEFLHQFDLSRMPECFFYTKYGECSNPDCLYRHITQDQKATECPWFKRGFCKHGPKCRHRHEKKSACQNYLAGFCPKGPQCELGHPKYEIPAAEGDKASMSRKVPDCYICHKLGHIAANCPQNRDRDQDIGGGGGRGGFGFRGRGGRGRGGGRGFGFRGRGARGGQW